MGRIWVRHAPESAALVRHALAGALEQASVDGSIVFDCVLISSELFGNAVRHARPLPSGHLLVCWDVADDQFTVAVTDGGSDKAVGARHAAPTECTGRGLAIVDDVSDGWGVTHSPDGTKTVWAIRTRAQHPAVRRPSALVAAG